MELRHLRCFLAVAEELHFDYASACLHIDQSPLSRTIEELELELGAFLFTRLGQGTQLTCVGNIFLQHVHRVFAALGQASESVKSRVDGVNGLLRIALSDCIAPPCLPGLLIRSREEDPEVEVRLFEVPLHQQIRGLHTDLYDAGFAMAEDAGDGIAVTPAWEDELMVAVPSWHSLLAFKQVPLEEVLRHPLVLGDPAACKGHALQVDRVLRSCGQEPVIVQRVATFDMMMTLVSAGLAVGLAGKAYLAFSGGSGVVIRRLAGVPPMLTTYLLRRMGTPSATLARFIERVASVDR